MTEHAFFISILLTRTQQNLVKHAKTAIRQSLKRHQVLFLINYLYAKFEHKLSRAFSELSLQTVVLNDLFSVVASSCFTQQIFSVESAQVFTFLCQCLFEQ